MRTSKFSILSGLTVLAAIVAWPGTAAFAVPAFTDDFNDNSTSPAWLAVTQGTGPTIAETNLRVEVTLPPGSVNGPGLLAGQAPAFAAFYLFNCSLRGDFDLQVDFSLLTWPSANGVNINLVAAAPPPQSGIGIGRIAGQNGGFPFNGYFSNVGPLAGGTPSGQFAPTSDLTGKFRLTRVGSTATSFYFSGGSWVQLNSSTRDSCSVRQPCCAATASASRASANSATMATRSPATGAAAASWSP